MRLAGNIIAQITAILPVNLAYFAAGIGCGWTSPILQKYKNSSTDFSLSTTDCSLIASLHYGGKEIACLVTLMLIDKFGRNPVFIFSAISSLAVWLGVLLTKSIPLHFVIRIVFGIAAGTAEMTAPVYIGENSSPTLRGVFGGICIISFYFGEVIAFIIGTYFSYQAVAIIGTAIMGLGLLTTIFLREPALYLLSKGQEEKAAKNFFILRGTSEATKREFEETKQSLQQQTRLRFSIKLLTDKSIRAVCLVNLFMYLTGFAPINAMSSLTFYPINHITPSELTIALGVFQLVGVAVSATFIERIGRRPLLMTSAAICFISQLVNSTVYYFNECGTPVPFTPWFLFICITLYSVVTAALIFPIATVIRGELLSPQLKPIVGCLSVVLNSILSLGMTTVFLMIAEMYGMKTNFAFFTIMSAAMFIYVYFDLPETKGLTLTEIQRSLKNKLGNHLEN